MNDHGTFPFGAPSTERPPRRPDGGADLFLLGVYPSAFHIRWRLPEWARTKFGWAREHVGALAVDVEPEVFWDGDGEQQVLEQWQTKVGWVDGDGPGSFGSCIAAMNGTSGRAVQDEVIAPLNVDPSRVWFTDCIPYFFIKSSNEQAQQAEVIRDIYEPIAAELKLGSATLPPRPSPASLVRETIDAQGKRLRSEIEESAAPVVVTLGEEARLVMHELADECAGPSTRRLQSGDGYGDPGSATFGGQESIWYALSHPGNRSSTWTTARSEWVSKVQKRG